MRLATEPHCSYDTTELDHPLNKGRAVVTFGLLYISGSLVIVVGTQLCEVSG